MNTYEITLVLLGFMVVIVVFLRQFPYLTNYLILNQLWETRKILWNCQSI